MEKVRLQAVEAVKEFKPPRGLVTPTRDPIKLLYQLATDLEWCLKNPRIRFDMGFWLKAERNGQATCTVCAAGAMLLRRLLRPTAAHSPYRDACDARELLGDEEDIIMSAINILRAGEVVDYLNKLATGSYLSRLPRSGALQNDLAGLCPKPLHGHVRRPQLRRFIVEIRKLAKALPPILAKYSQFNPQ